MLRDWRAFTGARPDDFVFPVLPNRAVFRDDRAAAQIPHKDGRGRPFSVHGLRKCFATWLDSIGCPAGIRSALLCHADTLAEARYTDHSIEEMRFWLEKMPNPWPAGLRVLPHLSTDVETKSQSDLTTRVVVADTENVRSAIQTIMQSEAMGPMTARAGLTSNGPEGLSPLSANTGPIGSDQHGNGHWRSENEGGLNALDSAVFALAAYVRRLSVLEGTADARAG